MPFIRHSRDKRGYECTYVMHAYRPGHGPARTRVLYLFRSPAYVKVGRKPLEPEVMEALEHTHPDLSFDWLGIPTHQVPPPHEADGRESRNDRRDRQYPRASPPPVPSAPPAVQDESLLGRIVGSERAGRLRARYSDLHERIVRRSRTPEDRDRLTQRLQRLNPDECPDETTLRSLLGTLEGEWTAIGAELPGRRRGRRGGRPQGERGPGPGNSEGPEAGDGPGTSDGVIIGEHEASYEEQGTSAVDRSSRADSDGDSGGDRGADAEAGAEHARAAESAEGTDHLPDDR